MMMVDYCRFNLKVLLIFGSLKKNLEYKVSWFHSPNFFQFSIQNLAFIDWSVEVKATESKLVIGVFTAGIETCSLGQLCVSLSYGK